MPRRKEGFDRELFGNLIAHADDVNLNERHVAFDKAVQHCEDNGLRFADGCTMWCGSGAVDQLTQENEDLRQKNDALQAELHKVERDAAEMVDRYEAQLAEVGKRERRKTRFHRSIPQFLQFTWGFPECRMIFFLTLAVARLLTFDRLLPRWSVPAFPVIGLLLLISWASAEIDDSGWGQLLIKAAAAVSLFILVYKMPVYAYGAAVIVTLVSVTKLVNRLSERLMAQPKVAFIVGLFV